MITRDQWKWILIALAGVLLLAFLTNPNQARHLRVIKETGALRYSRDASTTDLALLKSSRIEKKSKLGWPQFVNVVGQAQQESLFALGRERTTRGFGREFAFDRAKDCSSMDALSIALGGESGTHLSTHSAKLPTWLTSLGRNNTLGSNLLADVLVVAFTVKLGIGQNAFNGIALHDLIKQRAQSSAVINRSLVSLLRQDEAQTRIDSQEPFEPVTPRHRRAAVLLTPTNKKSADRSRSQARRIHCYAALAFARVRLPLLKTAHHFGQDLANDFFWQSQHEAKESRVIGHGVEFQRSSQLAMFGQPHFRGAEGPVLITHQTQNRQQLRLAETLRRKTMTVRRQNFPTHFQRHTGKRHKSNFAHASSFIHNYR